MGGKDEIEYKPQRFGHTVDGFRSRLWSWSRRDKRLDCFLFASSREVHSRRSLSLPSSPFVENHPNTYLSTR